MAPLLTRFRWAAAALVAMALLAPAAAAAEQRQEEPGLSALRAAVVAALANSRAADALDAIGNSLALLSARNRLEREGKLGPAAADAAAAADGAPAAADGTAAAAADGAAAEPTEAADADEPPEMITDPDKMPPASAGSNGSYTPRDATGRGDLFAHVRDRDPTTPSSILLSGIALAPPDAPEAVKGVIDNANSIVGRPYVWGGGHGSWYSHGYDCSGAVSFALYGGGLIPEPLTSGALEGWGAPGPGKWITVYANARHTFAEIAGLRFDTSGTESGTGPRWHLATASTAGFVARHPPGL